MKKTKKLINQLKPYWKRARDLENEFYNKLSQLELEMEKTLDIDGIEFFFCDNSMVGIGSFNREMPLVHYNELEKT